MASSLYIHTPDTNRFNIWHISDLYFGEPPSKEVWRPNVNDMVIDWDVGIYRVLSVNEESIPVLQLISRFSQDSRFNTESTSLITALSDYQPSAATKIFIDTSVSPAILSVDGRFVCYGSEPTRCVFFRGTDTSINGEVISEVYNGSGDLIGDQVPLELINAEGTIKRPVQFKTTKAIEAGEVVTAVFYTDSNGVYSKQPFLVSSSAGFRPGDISEKYIDSISLRGDALSDTQEDLIENTVGTPLNVALLKGVLHYNDGSETEVGIDGVKMVLRGLNNFDTSYVGTPTSVVLQYYPSLNEKFINGSINGSPSISHVYKLANIARDSSFSLKIFIVPVWDAGTTSYSYRYFLVNLEGDLFTEVTADVDAMLEGGGLLSGTDFTTRQDAVFSLDMSTISPTIYGTYVHTQKTDITIDQPGAISGQTWLIDYIGDQTNMFGQDLKASCNAIGDTINIANGIGILENWLTELYYAIEPLYDNTVLTQAPTPTHFSLIYDDVETDKVVLTDYSSNIPLSVGMGNFTNQDTVMVRWILETVDGDKTLGITPLFIKNDLA